MGHFVETLQKSTPLSQTILNPGETSQKTQFNEKKKNSYEEDADPRTPKKIFQHLSRLRSTGQSEEAAVRRSNAD
jgi:hypothetical protein